MKQWNVKGSALTFSMLSLSLVASAAFSQISEDNGSQTIQEVNIVEQQSMLAESNVPSNLRNVRVESQPVVITPGMSPAIIGPAPVTVLPEARVAGSNYVTPATGLSGTNSGTASTGGVIYIQNSLDNASTLENQKTISSRADLLKDERRRQEIENEVRLIEKVEEGRLEDERSRSTSIGGFSATSARQGEYVTVEAQSAAMATVPVSAVGSNVGSSVASANAVALSEVSTISTTVRSSSSSTFSLSPFAGYRWMEDGNTQFKVRNLYVTGVNLSGQMNKFLGLEGSFTYGRDEMRQRYYNTNVYNQPYNRNSGYYGNSYYGNRNRNTGSYYNQSSVYGFVRSRDSFDIAANAKLGYMVGSVRPYALGGIGGMMQKYNIDNSYTTQQARYAGFDRNTTHVTAQFGGGVDIELASNFTLGGRFDYQRVFDSNKYPLMNSLYGDGINRYRLVGSLQVIF